MSQFNHVSIEIPEIKTENINGGRYYVTPTGKKYVYHHRSFDSIEEGYYGMAQKSW